MRTLDIDQLQTFLAVAEEGGFTRASERVFKTQSAVSMQIKKLEEQVGRPLFLREGRTVRMTAEGLRLRDYANRMLKLNAEALALFHEPEVIGTIKIGLPDDYADRLLPRVLAGFARGHPGVEINVLCDSSTCINRRIADGRLDIGIVTSEDVDGRARLIRREPLHWITSDHHCIHETDPVPLALGPASCGWRHRAIAALDKVNRPWRLVYVSSSAAGLSGAVGAGLAVSIMPESGLRPDMRILTPADGFPELQPCYVGLLRADHATDPLFDAVEDHVVRRIGNLTPVAEAAE